MCVLLIACLYLFISFVHQLAHQCMREVRRAAIQAQKNCKETLPRARRLTKEMLLYWKKYEKVEKEHRKRAEKEALEQRRLDEEMKEVEVFTAVCLSANTNTELILALWASFAQYFQEYFKPFASLLVG